MTQPTNKPIKRCYVPGRKPLAGGLGAGGDATEADVLAVVERWNARIPRNRVRVLNQVRFDDTRYVINVLGREVVEAAIEHYSRQSWQRRRGAWKTYDNFIDVQVVTEWFERAEEAREKAEAAQGPKDPRVRKLQDEIAGKTRKQAAMRSLQERFDALPPTRQYHYLSQAKRLLYQQLGDQAAKCGPAVKAKARELFDADTAEARRKE